MSKYIDGRCKNLAEYKYNWYIKNKERILEKMKKNYYENKQRIKNQTQKAIL